jgi:ABC-type antimicrobial peptide transport system permease subunit
VGEGYSYRLSTFRAEADTTRWCGANSMRFLLGEQFFETQGLTPVEGSPSAEKLSNECPADGAVITRSMALALFGTDQAVGRRIVETDYDGDAVQHGPADKIVARYTVFGVVEDFRLRPRERYAYAILTRVTALSNNTPKMLIRLRSGEDADEFVIRLNSAERQLELMTGEYGLAAARTYTEYREQISNYDSESMLFSIMGTFIALLLLNVVIGTLGTFWLQIRKRTEDIGIMRSFGAKRRNVFWMLWREAALLTFVACVIGWVIWLQFAMNIGLAQGFTMTGTGQETDWVNTFWLHYLVICVIQYVLLLIIVTLGMVVPTIIAMYKRPVEALRHE